MFCFKKKNNNKKYKLLKNDTIKVFDKTLCRIKALKDFSNVKVGDLGGYIESEANLDHSGDCWVFSGAQVCGEAKVCGEARVFDKAQVYDGARVYDKARVYGEAKVFGKARVSGEARVFDKARVYGWAEVYGEAHLKYGKIANKDIMEKENIKQLILHSMNVLPQVNKKGKEYYVLYKKVIKTNTPGVYKSLHDKHFTYTLGEIKHCPIETNDPLVSCSSGMHVCTPTYWDQGNTLIEVIVPIDAIYTCMGGKIRCTRLKVKREVKI